jgi:hypothetical protein
LQDSPLALKRETTPEWPELVSPPAASQPVQAWMSNLMS